MIKVLFLIHDLGQGGAEKVLVNLVNHMDQEKFDISVTALFGGGVNEQFLNKDVHYNVVFPKEFPANSKIMKLFTRKQLYKMCVKAKYDIEISYLEGSSARVISGSQSSDTKLVSWIHSEQHTMKKLSKSFRNEKETRDCYKRFDKIICVSEYIKNDLTVLLNGEVPCDVLYNTVESEKIMNEACETAVEIKDNGKIRLVATGSLKEEKGYDRLLRIIKRLKDENYQVDLYILGRGPQKKNMEKYILNNNLSKNVTLLGYQLNPYKYVAKCDLFICSSYVEGFSTAATEALIVGTPVCTVEVSGMRELLGAHNEYGVVVENDEKALYLGIKNFLDNPEKLLYYKQKAKERGKSFNTEQTVKAVENMLLTLQRE